MSELARTRRTRRTCGTRTRGRSRPRAWARTRKGTWGGAALQHDAGPSQVSLIDEIEHGLEPHRIARLLKHLKGLAQDQTKPQQVFMTTHSPVVIRELAVREIFRVCSEVGTTTVVSVA